MSRYDESLAYGDIPQRWDRSRFERYGRGGGETRKYEDDFRFVERDSPGRRDVLIAERSKSRGPRGRFEERDRIYEDDVVYTGGRRRRTDRELFGDVDPNEYADMQLQPYRRRSVSRRGIEIDITREREAPRPGLLRRQSSLDTFDRRTTRHERDEGRIAPYVPIPLPVRRRREFETEGYREVEIERERSVHRRGGSRRRSEAGRSIREETKSVHAHESDASGSESIDEKEEKISVHGSRRAPSVRSRARSQRAPSVHETIREVDIEKSVRGGSVHESELERSVREERQWNKGKTRMPKRLVRVEAIRDLGYPFDEEEHFIVLRVALQKPEIDEILSLSKTYIESKQVYKYEASEPSIPAPPIGEREIVERTEWINPPSVIGTRAGRSRSRRPRSRSREGETIIEERKTVIESRAPSVPRAPDFFEERRTVIEERSPSHARHNGALVLAERELMSDRDVSLEIRALEHERRALRLEREAGEKRELALRIRDHRSPEEEMGLVEFRRPRAEYLEVVTRERSPSRDLVRIDRDKKDRRERNNARLLGAALASLT